MKLVVGQRVVAVKGLTPFEGYYGHIVRITFLPVWSQQPKYWVQLIGRTKGRTKGRIQPGTVTPDYPYPFFENEIEAVD